jgi:hypothetical protein
MKKDVLYFAHPVNTYNTQLEQDMLALIATCFPEMIIENPNQPQHQAGYKEWKERCKDTPSQGMNYFFDAVLPDCEAGTVALPFLDGRLGAGVAGETIFSLKKERGIWLLEPTETCFNLRPFWQNEAELLFGWEKRINETPNREEREKVENELVLSIKETRVYTWLILYKVMKPYGSAHLDKTFSTE